MQSWLSVVIVKKPLKEVRLVSFFTDGWGQRVSQLPEWQLSFGWWPVPLFPPGSRGVCVCWRLWSVWLVGRSAVGLEWSGSSHHGALRQQWQPRALTDSGHYHLLSAPFASGQEHLTLSVVTKCCWTAGSKVKYSLSWSGGFPLHQH